MNTPKSKLQTAWDLKSNLQVAIGLGVLLLLSYGFLYRSPSFRQSQAAINQAYSLLETRSKKNAAQAVPLLNEAARLTPYLLDVYTNRGYAYELLEEYDKAADNYSHALTIKAGDEWTYASYMGVLLASGQTQLALKESKRFSELKPYNVDAYLYQGIAYQRLKMYPQALQNFDKAIELKPNTAKFHLFKADVLREQGEYERALAACNMGIHYSSGKDVARAYIMRGLIFEDENNLEKALEAYDAAIKADPRYKVGFVNRGALYSKLEKYSRALKDFNRAIAIDPEYWLAFYNRGYAYWELEKFPSALSDFNQVIKLYPKHKQSYFYRAQISEQREEWQKAIADYTKALALDKSDDAVRVARAWAYFQSGKAVEAEQDSTFLIHQKKQLTTAYTCRGLARLLQFRDDEARQDFARARAIGTAEENKASAAAWRDFEKTIAETKARRNLKRKSNN